jgi:hypothetical protein
VPTRNPSSLRAIRVPHRQNCLEQACKYIAAWRQDQALAGDAVLLAFRGNGSEFSLYSFAGERTVEDMDQEELLTGSSCHHLHGVAGNPVCID